MRLISAAGTVVSVLAVFAVTESAVTIGNVAVRISLPEGRGLSGVCLYRNGPDKRRHVMFKSVASARKKQDVGGDYIVAGDLAADRVYEGTFARLEDGDQVARFRCNRGQRFEVATPFVVPDGDLNTMLAVKESMEVRFGAQPSRQKSDRLVTAEHVSVTLRGLRPPNAVADDDDGAVVVDVFQLYKKPTVVAPIGLWDSKTSGTATRYSAYPYARYSIRYPVGDLMLADLPPDQMLAVKFRRPADNATTGNSIFVYTGGLYPRGTANLTRMLQQDEPGLHDTVIDSKDATDDNDDDEDTDTAASSVQIDAKHAHHDSYDIIKNTVKCYADGMVYNGYPCRNSEVCIPLGWLCDNQKDCLEGDDEYNCYNTEVNSGEDTNNLYNNIDNWYYTRGTCKKFEFRCRSRRMSVCLPNSWLCDGRVDCDDGWDENEFNCGRTYGVLGPGTDFNSREDHTCANKNVFKCWRGTGCIGLRAVCDGVKDCADGSDERVCDNWSSHSAMGMRSPGRLSTWGR